jgi:peptide/nickel transport system substrate-binding protein
VRLYWLMAPRLFALRDGAVVPDAAAELPAVATAMVVRLRTGRRWGAQQPRPLVAADFVRGIKRIAYPDARPGRRVLADLIEGLGDYCAAYDAQFSGSVPTAPDLAQFQMAHDVPGLRATDPQTLEIRLTGPVPDILTRLAGGFAAAAPRELDYHLPGSVEGLRTMPSAGPYRVDRARSTARLIVLVANPSWDAAADPLRRHVADRVEVPAGAVVPDDDGPALRWFPPGPAG